MKLSIITVSFNSLQLLEKTIRSVESSEFKNYEYIVVDGASTDGTPAMLTEYEPIFSLHSIKFTWESSRDLGIYDAMNKGLAKATGDFVFFLNCGDTINSTDTISKIFNRCGSAGFIYCYTKLVHPSGEIRNISITPQLLTYASMNKGMTVSHQGIIVQRNLCPYYDLEYTIMADYDWCLKILKKKPVIYRHEDILTVYLLGGASAQQFQQRWRDRWRLVKNYFGVKGVLVNMPFYVYDSLYWKSEFFRKLADRRRHPTSKSN
jgi:glycosyltransferase involved in cell wall biosynthesis